MVSNLSQEASDALAKADYKRAYDLYRILATKGETEELRQTAFQNGGACLRKLDKQKEAIEFLKEGIALYPYAPGIHHNLGNALRDLGGSHRWSALVHYDKAEKAGLSSIQRLISHAALCHELGYPLQAYACFLRWQKSTTAASSQLTEDLLQLLLELSTRLFDASDADPIASWCLEQLHGRGQDNPVNQLALAVSLCRMKRPQEAIGIYRKTLKRVLSGQATLDLDAQKTLVNASWNLSCSLLKAGEMQAGWELYEYGLRAPAKGAQRWQRALPKLFTFEELAVWRGEDIKGKKLLVIGEQAVGDTMMFLQLVPELIRQKAKVSLAVQERLAPIYQRTYPHLNVYAVDDNIDDLLGRGGFSQSDFDFQIPCGSLPQHCLSKWIQLPDQEVQLKSDPDKFKTFHARYREGIASNAPVIGISWRGGGKSERIRVKSLPVEEFKEILTGVPARFVSLQYGEAESQIKKWQEEGIDAVYDNEVDAISDLDTWLAQVKACDLVISVANTTVHGSGGLGIPTLCLQSRGSDWRWVDGMPYSYWYSSVDTVIQDRRGGWGSAVEAAIGWVSAQWPDPAHTPRDFSQLSFTSMRAS